MEITSVVVQCPNCNQDFDETNHIPLVLPCNHSICKPCVTGILPTNASCPKCQNPIIKNLEELPVSHMVINCIKGLKRKQKIKNETQILINMISNQILEILKILSPFTTRLMTTQANLYKLNKILQNDAQIQESEFKKITNQVEEYYKATLEILIATNTAREIQSSTSTPPLEFFKNLHDGLKNGERIYTFHRVNNEIKFGMISSEKNTILFHCLDLSEVPINCSFMQFTEIKQHLQVFGTRTFIKLNLGKDEPIIVVIEMIMSQKERMNLFINLCTGENGVSYKSYSQFGVPNSGQIDYRTRLLDVNLKGIDVTEMKTIDNSYIGYKEDTGLVPISKPVFVELLFRNGSFSLYSSDPASFLTYIGRVLFPTDIEELLSQNDVPSVNIVDCGIVISV